MSPALRNRWVAVKNKDLFAQHYFEKQSIRHRVLKEWCSGATLHLVSSSSFLRMKTSLLLLLVFAISSQKYRQVIDIYGKIYTLD